MGVFYMKEDNIIYSASKVKARRGVKGRLKKNERVVKVDIATGQVLRDIRTEQGLKIAVIARATGVSGKHLSEVERGRLSLSTTLLFMILDILGLEISNFYLQLAKQLKKN